MARIIAGCVIGLIVAYIAFGDTGERSECVATMDQPCVVSFDAPMYEDEFDIDYTGDGRVYVYRVIP